jgi:CRISPR-associated protein Csd1
MILTSLARFCLEHRISKTRDDDFQYVEALKALSAATGNHRLDIGGLQIVFWSDTPQGDAFLSLALRAVSDDEADRRSPQVRTWLDQLNAGDPFAPQPFAGQFHVLGLSQTEASPMIRFWITDALLGLPDRVKAFWEDLRFETADRPCPATILNMLAQAAPAESRDLIALRLTQDILTAMLSGVDLPPDLLPAIVRRIRADGRIDDQRAAVLKAALARRARLSGARAAPAVLDPAAPDTAYRLGRLFALLDAVGRPDQDRRPPNIRFRRLAAAAPAATALGLSGVAYLRLAGLMARNGPLAGALKPEIDALLRSLWRRFPAYLSVESQARFALGLYQQSQAPPRP